HAFLDRFASGERSSSGITTSGLDFFGDWQSSMLLQSGNLKRHLWLNFAFSTLLLF
ncbi:hypothetical protein CPB85DRAFT_1297448, partial [Mucidula mucida]